LVEHMLAAAEAQDQLLMVLVGLVVAALAVQRRVLLERQILAAALAAAARSRAVVPATPETEALALFGCVIQTHLPLLQRRGRQQSHALAAIASTSSPALAL
jgi:hypothetical protein